VSIGGAAVRVLVATLLLVGGGITILFGFENSNGSVRCGDRIMKPDQYCSTSLMPAGRYDEPRIVEQADINRVTTGYFQFAPYVDVEQAQRSKGRTLLILGGAVILVAFGLVSWRLSDRKRATVTTGLANQGRDPRAERIRRAIGWPGVLGMLSVAGSVVVFAVQGVSEASPELWLVPGWMLIGAIVVGWRLGRHPRPQKTESWRNVVGPLIHSTKEYCLILRSFGGDETIIVSHVPKRLNVPILRPNASIEQVVALAVQKILGLQTYAFVDQKIPLAPPGPVWLQAPYEGDEWKLPAGALIARAHSIILILPPGQSIGESTKWEIGQTTIRGFQTRLIVVLPPPDQFLRGGYIAARHNMCVVLPALEGFAGEVNENDVRIGHYKERIPRDTLAAKLSRIDGGNDRSMERWPVHELRRWGETVTAGTYLDALKEALASVDRELSNLSFAERYPWPLPPLPGSDDHGPP